MRNERTDPITGATGEYSCKHFIRHSVRDGLTGEEGDGCGRGERRHLEGEEARVGAERKVALCNFTPLLGEGSQSVFQAIASRFWPVCLSLCMTRSSEYVVFTLTIFSGNAQVPSFSSFPFAVESERSWLKLICTHTRQTIIFINSLNDKVCKKMMQSQRLHAITSRD